MFCVECGAEGRTYGGVCLQCLTERRALASLPRYVDVTRCKRCGSFHLGGTWSSVERDEALRTALEGATEVDPLVSMWSLTAFTVEEEDEANFRSRAEYAITLDENRVPWEAGTKVRMKGALCPACSRKSGGYYEAILQVRGDGRDLAESEMEEVRAIVDGALSSKSDAFVSREEEIHGGVDLYLSSASLGKRLASSVRKALGGIVSASSSLYGRKDGRDLYRTTYLVRIPGYSPGDVLDMGGRMMQVASSGDTVTLVDLSSGDRESVDAASLAGVTPLNVVRASAVVVSRRGDEAQILDPVTYEAVTMRLAARLSEGAKDVPVVRVGDNLYLDLWKMAAGD